MQKEKQKTVIVLGVARSGTSAVSGVLHYLGFDMGVDIKSAFSNPYGFFEDKEFNALLKKILKLAKKRKRYHPYDYWLNPPSTQETKSAILIYKKEIRELVKKKSKNKTLWGWKNPMSHFVLDAVVKHTINPHFIVVQRNPFDILNSANKSFRGVARLPNNTKLQVIIYHINFIYESISRFTKVPVLYVNYDKLVKNPLTVAESLANFLGLDLDKEKENKIIKFIIPRNKIMIIKITSLISNHIKFMISSHKKAFKIILKNYNDPRIIYKEIRLLFKLYKQKYVRDLKATLKMLVS